MNIFAQLQLAAVPPPTETHPIVQCITKNDLKNLMKENNINGVYPCRECRDYVTPLIADVINNNSDVSSYLLHQGANSNEPSQLRWTPLHYVSLFKASLYFCGSVA